MTTCAQLLSLPQFPVQLFQPGCGLVPVLPSVQMPQALVQRIPVPVGMIPQGVVQKVKRKGMKDKAAASLLRIVTPKPCNSG